MFVVKLGCMLEVKRAGFISAN